MTVAVFLLSLVGAMAIGVPVAFALIACAIVLMAWLGSFDTQIISQNIIGGADSYQLLAVPFFLLAGEFMNEGGLSRRLVAFATTCLGHFHGGLGYVAIVAGVLMAAMSGAAVADTAALAAILIPMMREAGYNVPRAAGLCAASGIIAPVIPPSVGLILFGVAANVSIPKLFVAGIVPGLLMGIALIVTWAVCARRENIAPIAKASFAARVRAFRDGFFALLMPMIVIGGIRFGIVTPTEAGVLAAAYALLVGTSIYREITWRSFYQAVVRACRMSAVIMFLVAASFAAAWLITQANIPGELAAFLAPLIDHPKVLMLMMMILVVVVGTALDFAPTVLILTPVLMPIVHQAGIDPVYFGVLFIINNAIGLLTPPVGIVLNVVCGVARVPLSQVIRGVNPFLWSLVALMFLMVIIPELVTWPYSVLRGG